MRMSNHKFKYLLILGIIGMVFGCKSTGGYKMHECIEGRSINNALVLLVVTPPPPEFCDNDNVVTLFREQLASRLVSSGLCSDIAKPNDENADYCVNVKLTLIDEASTAARALIGVFAGSHEIAGDVSVIDLKTKETIRSFSFTGESAAHPYSGESNLQFTVMEAVDAVIAGLS